MNGRPVCARSHAIVRQALAQHPRTHRHDQSALLGDGDELVRVRRDGPARRPVARAPRSRRSTSRRGRRSAGSARRNGRRPAPCAAMPRCAGARSRARAGGRRRSRGGPCRAASPGTSPRRRAAAAPAGASGSITPPAMPIDAVTVAGPSSVLIGQRSNCSMRSPTRRATPNSSPGGPPAHRRRRTRRRRSGRRRRTGAPPRAAAPRPRAAPRRRRRDRGCR